MISPAAQFSPSLAKRWGEDPAPSGKEPRPRLTRRERGKSSAPSAKGPLRVATPVSIRAAGGAVHWSGDPFLGSGRTFFVGQVAQSCGERGKGDPDYSARSGSMRPSSNALTAAWVRSET